MATGVADAVVDGAEGVVDTTDFVAEWRNALRRCSDELEGDRPALKLIARSLRCTASHVELQVQRVSEVQDGVVAAATREICGLRDASLRQVETAIQHAERAVAAAQEVAVALQTPHRVGDAPVKAEARRQEGAWGDALAAAHRDALDALRCAVRAAGAAAADAASSAGASPDRNALVEKLSDASNEILSLKEDRARLAAEIEVLAERLALAHHGAPEGGVCASSSSGVGDGRDGRSVLTGDASLALEAHQGMAPPPASTHREQQQMEQPPPAVWAAAVRAAEESAVAKAKSAAAQIAAKDAELEEMRTALASAAEDSRQALAEAQRLTFENGVLAAQVTSLLSRPQQHQQSASDELKKVDLTPKRALHFAALGGCELPSDSELRGTSLAARHTSKPAADEVDFAAFCANDIAALVARNRELTRQLWITTQQRGGRGGRGGGGGGGSAPDSGTGASADGFSEGSAARDASPDAAAVATSRTSGRRSVPPTDIAARHAARLSRLSSMFAPRDTAADVGSKRPRGIDVGEFSGCGGGARRRHLEMTTTAPLESLQAAPHEGELRWSQVRPASPLGASVSLLPAWSPTLTERRVATRDAATQPDHLMLLAAEGAAEPRDAPPPRPPAPAGTLLQHPIVVSVEGGAAWAEQLSRASHVAVSLLAARGGQKGAHSEAIVGSHVEVWLRAALKKAVAVVASQETLIAARDRRIASLEGRVAAARSHLDAATAGDALRLAVEAATSTLERMRCSLDELRETAIAGCDPVLRAMREQQQEFDAQWRTAAETIEASVARETSLLQLLDAAHSFDARTAAAAAAAGGRPAGADDGSIGIGSAGDAQVELALVRERAEVDSLRRARDEAAMRELRAVEHTWLVEEAARALQQRVEEHESAVASGALVPAEQLEQMTEHCTEVIAQREEARRAVDELRAEAARAEAAHCDAVAALRREVEERAAARQLAEDELAQRGATISKLESALEASEARTAAALHDAQVLSERLEERAMFIAALQREAAEQAALVSRLEGRVLSRDDARALLQELFPSADAALERCTALAAKLGADNAALADRVGALEVELARLREDAAAAHRRFNAEQRARQALEVERVQLAREAEARRQPLTDAAAGAVVREALLEREVASAAAERDAALEREVVLRRQVRLLAEDPVSANVRRFGLTKTENLQAQLEELGERLTAAEASRRETDEQLQATQQELLAAKQQAAELREKLRVTDAELQAGRAERDDTLARVTSLDAQCAAAASEREKLQAECGRQASALQRAQQTEQQRTAECEGLRAQLLDALKARSAAETSAREAGERVQRAQADAEAAMTEAAELERQLSIRSADCTRLTQDNLTLQEQCGRLHKLAVDLRAAAARAPTAPPPPPVAQERAPGAAAARAPASSHRVAAGRHLTAGLGQ